ncbi:Ig-like domain-containing protein [Chloroflexota bacterium]
MFNRIKQMQRIQKVKTAKTQGEKGQSLVEMAIILPLLLLLFVGVFEVGWAVRGYLVLANVNRETVRYGIKNGVLDYSIKDPATVGYDKVLSHTMDSLASQLPLEFAANPNTTVIMSHFVIDTAFPCIRYQGGKPVVPYEFDSACDCTEDDPNHSQWFTGDDLIAHPGDPNYPHYLETYGISRTTRLGDSGDYQPFVDQLTLENNQLNCTILKTGSAGELSANNLLIAEAFYDQPQLLGVPFLSNSLTDPIPFYSHTAMRLVSSREADTTNTVGPVCELLPITFPESALDDPDNPTPGQSIDAFQGSASGNFGWMYWNSDPSNTTGINYIEEALANPRLSMNDFIADEDDPDCDGYATGECPDTAINIADWVTGRTGVGNNSTIDDLLESYRGKTVLVPVYDDIGSQSGANASYSISHFALITIDEVCLPRNSCPGVSGNEKLIRATIVKYDDEACSGNNSGGTPGNDPPVAMDDTVTTDKDTPITINILNNDSDPDGDTITIDSFTQPAKGNVVDNGDGTVTYTPKNNSSGVGTFTFTYTISDGHGSTDAATVTVTVTN